ncbi:unnamed protein product [Caenorhabditis angaria]|uniref:Serine/threonine-protein phosphatase PGAM5, mitochondrial n=1 Tax=Caenorhabditis angaria TaxID=860376 RepID=A0A9P1MWD5_9PELO|nr:unnamed protein product [Caenorhabditis angaria]
MVTRVLKYSIPTVTTAISAYYLSDENNRNSLIRTVTAKAFREESKFDSYFPRGEWDHNWDFRDPESLVDRKKYNKANEEEKEEIIGSSKEEQADLLGKRLAISDIKFDKLLMSTMNRATETANIILGHFPDNFPRSSSSMIEEGPPYPPVPEHREWRPAAPEFYSEAARIEAAYRKLFHRAPPSQKQDSYELVVCHANVIRYFVCRALQFPPEGWLRMSLGNCSLTWVVIRPSGNVSIRSIGDIGHLAPHKVSFT